MAFNLKSLVNTFSSPKKARPAPPRKPTPEMLKNDLIRCWTYIHKTFFTDAAAARPNLTIAETELAHRLTELGHILVTDYELSDAENRDTGVCMEYFLNNHIMQHLYEHAAADYPKGMLLEGASSAELGAADSGCRALTRKRPRPAFERFGRCPSAQ